MESASVTLPSAAPLPRFGLGAWGYGEDRARRGGEIAALRRASKKTPRRVRCL